MTKRKPLQWWVIPGIITGCLTMLGGLGTCAVKYATLEAMPVRLEAAEQKNDQQDSAIDKLTAIQSTWQDIYQQQQQQVPNQRVERPAQPSGLRQWDLDGLCWECPLVDEDRCYDEQLWNRCR